MARLKYPIGIQDFEKIRKGNYLYFDKTEYVYDLVTQGCVYFLSRPRRFGKSLLISTLKSYFLGHKEFFKGLAIDSLETDWYEYPVMHLSFIDNFTQAGTLEKTLECFIADEEDIYGRGKNANTLAGRFRAVIANAHKATGRGVVVLIDEYDKPLLDVMGLERYVVQDGEKITLEENNRRVLKEFFGVLKSADADLQFVFLTGVTKFSQISVFSGFNQPKDISMSTRYDAICGITKEELYTTLDEPIKEMAEKYKVTPEQMRQMLKKKYDGYHFSSRMMDIYNPFSLLNAFSDMELNDYWFASGSPEYLVRLLAKSGENINELAGQYYPTADFVDYRADVEKPLPMIYQSGYLTIKGFDSYTRTYCLDFPNEEVRQGFLAIIASSYFKTNDSPQSWAGQIVDALYDADLDQLERLFTAFFASIPYEFRTSMDKERHFQYTFYLMLSLISGYAVYAEKHQSEGRVDCVVETDDDVYIFEFKRDGSAEEALKQIEEKGYAREYSADARRVHCLGVNFSSQTGTIDGWAVK